MLAVRVLYTWLRRVFTILKFSLNFKFFFLKIITVVVFYPSFVFFRLKINDSNNVIKKSIIFWAVRYEMMLNVQWLLKQHWRTMTIGKTFRVILQNNLLVLWLLKNNIKYCNYWYFFFPHLTLGLERDLLFQHIWL